MRPNRNWYSILSVIYLITSQLVTKQYIFPKFLIFIDTQKCWRMNTCTATVVFTFCFSLRSPLYSPYSVDAIENLSSWPELAKSELRKRVGWEHNHANPSVVIADFEPSHNVHHKVETSSKVSSPIHLNTARSVDQETEIKSCLAFCDNLREESNCWANETTSKYAISYPPYSVDSN